MPVYHFNLFDGEDRQDSVGSEHRDTGAAQIEAVRRMGGVLMDHAGRFWSGQEWTMQVTDARGLVLFSLTLLGLQQRVHTAGN